MFYHTRHSGRWTSRLMALLLALSLLWVTAWALELPKPTKDFYVADFANVLSSETKEDIIQRSRTLKQETGAEVVVVTVDFLDGTTIDQYAHSLFDAWKIGASEGGEGLLLLLAIGEDDYWCVQSTGLQTQFNRGAIEDLLYTYLKPDFSSGNYDAGVQKTVDALYDQVESAYHIDRGADPSSAPEVVPVPVPERSQKNSPSLLHGVFSFVSSVGKLIGALVMAVVALTFAFVIYFITMLVQAIQRRWMAANPTRRPPLFWKGRGSYGPPPPPRNSSWRGRPGYGPPPPKNNGWSGQNRSGWRR